MAAHGPVQHRTVLGAESPQPPKTHQQPPHLRPGQRQHRHRQQVIEPGQRVTAGHQHPAPTGGVDQQSQGASEALIPKPAAPDIQVVLRVVHHQQHPTVRQQARHRRQPVEFLPGRVELGDESEQARIRRRPIGHRRRHRLEQRHRVPSARHRGDRPALLPQPAHHPSRQRALADPADPHQLRPRHLPEGVQAARIVPQRPQSSAQLGPSTDQPPRSQLRYGPSRRKSVIRFNSTATVASTGGRSACPITVATANSGRSATPPPPPDAARRRSCSRISTATASASAGVAPGRAGSGRRPGPATWHTRRSPPSASPPPTPPTTTRPAASPVPLPNPHDSSIRTPAATPSPIPRNVPANPTADTVSGAPSSSSNSIPSTVPCPERCNT